MAMWVSGKNSLPGLQTGAFSTRVHMAGRERSERTREKKGEEGRRERKEKEERNEREERKKSRVYL